MASSMTLMGEQYSLGDLAGGGLTIAATQLVLYDSSSVPNVDGTGFTMVTPGNGYSIIDITYEDWEASLDTGTGHRKVVLKPGGNEPVITADGGPIPTIAGAAILDADDNVLAWWARAGGAVTLANGESLTLQDLTVGAG